MILDIICCTNLIYIIFLRPLNLGPIIQYENVEVYDENGQEHDCSKDCFLLFLEVFLDFLTIAYLICFLYNF